MGCFIVPQYVYSNLRQNGSEQEQSFAQAVLDELHRFTINPMKTLDEYFRHSKNTPNEPEEEVVSRTIYDAQHKMQLPGTLVRREGEASNGDVSADEAYEWNGVTWDVLQAAYKRNSVDNRGMELKNTVNYGRNFGNAFWTGDQMVFGNGDGQIFDRFTILDVVAHEIHHGVCQHTANLRYRYQSGALNESWSDIFGSMTKQFFKNQLAKDADWLIGEGLFTKKVNGRALRSMKEPGTAYDDPKIGKDPQPKNMKEYVKTDQDNGGVHINSSIPNRAFCNAAINMGGKSWERAGKIWYQTLVKEMKPNSQFQDAVNATVKVAGQLYGENSIEQKSVVEGWKIVGLSPQKGWW